MMHITMRYHLLLNSAPSSCLMYCPVSHSHAQAYVASHVKYTEGTSLVTWWLSLQERGLLDSNLYQAAQLPAPSSQAGELA